jgi:cellulose synthase/poly-beta-1,6-N-acetylglucosamine synthase-like glycosyltransferase
MLTGTIVVHTRNRVRLLENCLTSIDNQALEPGRCDVLVVDNGSSDGTAELLETWRRSAPDRRVVVETRAGISNARNRSLQTVTRDVLLSVDDDALVAAGWARAHLAVYESRDDVGAVGGPVGLHWPAGRPAWITDELTFWYSRLELGDDMISLPSHGPYGVNMSIRRSAALAVGGFDPWLGRVGHRLISGEEPELTRRLRAAGWDVVYEPGAAVVQQVMPERLDRRWLQRRGWAQGVTNARLEFLADRPGRQACASRSVDELRDAAGRWWRRRRGVGGEEELDSLCRILAHTAAGLEYARLAVRRAPAARSAD